MFKIQRLIYWSKDMQFFNLLIGTTFALKLFSSLSNSITQESFISHSFVSYEFPINSVTLNFKEKSHFYRKLSLGIIGGASLNFTLYAVGLNKSPNPLVS